MKRSFVLALACVLFAGAAPPDAPVRPHASHVTIVIMENRDYASIAGNARAPYFNGVLTRDGALLQNSHGVAHPSEPNYLGLFSGSTQGVTNDACPLSFDGRNLGADALAKGVSFAGYSESMPADGFTGCYANLLYARKHNPWSNFRNVPASSNRVFRGWPDPMPQIAIVAPNLCHDMHDCSTREGDEWLSKNLPAIIAWDAKNDGLLVVTWDEASPDFDGTNRIATVLVGPMVRAGAVSDQRVDHYGVLRTVEAIFGLPCVNRSCDAAPITGIWR